MASVGAGGGPEQRAVEDAKSPTGLPGGESRPAGTEPSEWEKLAVGEGAEAANAGKPVRLPWLRVRDQAVVAALAGVVLVSLGVYYGRVSGWGRGEVELERLPEHELDYRLDPNRANWVEWMQLPGIGKTLADRIVKDREERGEFRSVDDLLRVKGIGKVNLERMRPYLRMEEKTEGGRQKAELRGRTSDGRGR